VQDFKNKNYTPRNLSERDGDRAGIRRLAQTSAKMLSDHCVMPAAAHDARLLPGPSPKTPEPNSKPHLSAVWCQVR